MSKDKLIYRLVDKSRLLDNLKRYNLMLILEAKHVKIVDKKTFLVIKEKSITSDIIQEVCK